MNANLGIVFRKCDREKLLSPIPPRLRTWGNETIEEEGPLRFSAPGLDGVEFQTFPLTKFIRDQIPSSQQGQELEYAWMTGPHLDAYEIWAMANLEACEKHALEAALATLLENSSFWAVMFAPEGERLGVFGSADVRKAVRELRRGASDVVASEGFLIWSS